MKKEEVKMISIEKIKDDFLLYYGRKEQIESGKTEKELISIEKLAEDISKNGLNNPLIVYEQNGVYEIKDGTHRIRALKKLNWKEVPCIIVDYGRQARPCPIG